MKATIIGGVGSMGRCLIDQLSKGQFLDLGINKIVVADPSWSDSLKNRYPCDISGTTKNVVAVKEADIVFVSVPIEKSTAVIKEISKSMKSQWLTIIASGLRWIVSPSLEWA